MVFIYQRQFQVEDENIRQDSKTAAEELIKKFEPLFTKYLAAIRMGHINFRDVEIKKFVAQFMEDKDLQDVLRGRRFPPPVRHLILQRFNFIKEVYGKQTENEILTDLQIILLDMAKRYKQVGRNFCAYIHNVYCFEIARHIKKYIRSIDNVHYKKIQYADNMQSHDDEEVVTLNFEDKIYENNFGIPDLTWISGKSCSEIFSSMDVLERLCLVKYYLEDCSDKAIAESIGLPFTYINQKRKSALGKLVKNLNSDISQVKRSRKPNKNKFFKL